MGIAGEGISPARRAARLAMLAPDSEAEARIEGELKAIIDFADELNALQAPPEPAPEPLAAHTALRSDEPKPGLAAADALMNAKSVSGRLITIPRAFD